MSHSSQIANKYTKGRGLGFRGKLDVGRLVDYKSGQKAQTRIEQVKCFQP